MNLDNIIAHNLLGIGAITLDDYIAGAPLRQQAQPHPVIDTAPDVNAITRLHQTCQGIFRTTDALKFEFVDHAGSKNKQCILTITKPDGTQRSYITQPTFAKKSEAKSEVAKIAIDMGALDFLSDGMSERDVNTASLPVSEDKPVQTSASVEEIETCCREWRAGCVTPYWVFFSDPKLMHKQGCALRISLSSHVHRIYLANPTFDSYLDAQDACAKSAISEGVIDFIKHGNGQTCPSSPAPSTAPTTSPPVTPWTLQSFYDALPRPFPETFETNDASEINALGWLNTMVQYARGGKLVLSFFFTSDGPPGLHGCLLKLDRPGEYKAFLVDARFTKRSDAKAAACLQAMSKGIGNYIRAIASAVDSKITPAMRSFSSSLVYPALTSELGKIDTKLQPQFEYDKEIDAFGATLVLGLSMSPTPEQIRRYTVPAEYRIKADAKVGVICHAAEHGAVEFVRFRGRPPPDDYVSPYTLQGYNPDASRKRKQHGSADDPEPSQSAKKRKKKSHKRLEQASMHLTPVDQYVSGSRIHDIPGPGDMGLPQSRVRMDDGCDPSQPGVGYGRGSDSVRSVGYPSYGAPIHVPMTYPAVLDPRYAVGNGRRGFDALVADEGYGAASPAESRVLPGSSSRPGRPVEPGELEPGEVVSTPGSDFSVSSSRHEDGEVDERETDRDTDTKGGRESEERAARRKIKGKGKETSPATTLSMTDRQVSQGNGVEKKNERIDLKHILRGDGAGGRNKEKEMSPAVTVSTTVSQDRSSGSTTAATSHVDKLIAYCAAHNCGTPSFHEVQHQDQFQVWIVIGKERFDLPTTYGSVEEGRQRVAKQVLARLIKGPR